MNHVFIFSFFDFFFVYFLLFGRLKHLVENVENLNVPEAAGTSVDDFVVDAGGTAALACAKATAKKESVLPESTSKSILKKKIERTF